MRKLTAMIVDDDAHVGRIFSKALGSIGLETEIVQDSQQVMAKVFAEAPDLITLDVQMPQVSGLDILRQIRSDHTLDSMRIMMVTANERAVESEEIQNLADVVLLKPVTPSQIQDFANRLLHMR